MKFLLDLLPVLLFFVTFRFADGHKEWASEFATRHFGGLVSGGTVAPADAPVLLSTVVVILATLAQVLYLKLRGRKVDLMLWISLALVVVLGSLTIWLHNENFIKWKPSGLYWAFGITLWVSQALFRKNLLRSMLGEKMVLPDLVWQKLNFAWVAFFAVMGLLNLWVAYTFPTSVWVSYKAFGGTGLMVLFVIGQSLYLSRHLPEDTEVPAPPHTPPSSGTPAP
jgi:intracellular septation protein